MLTAEPSTRSGRLPDNRSRARLKTSGASHMYIGPDTLMPVASALAAIAGIVLMFWRRTVMMVRLGASKVGRGLSRITGKR